MRKWLCTLVCVSCVMGQSKPVKQPPLDQAHKGGPNIEATRKLGVTPHIVLTDMFNAVEKFWFPQAYEQTKHMEYRLDMSADLPASAVSHRGRKLDSSGGSIDFDVNLDGVAAPSGQFRMNMRGGLGEVEVTRDQRRTLVASDDFKSFSDTPMRRRKKGANLTNWRSYFMRHLTAMKTSMMDSGAYRSFYKGSGTYQGREVDIIRVYKPKGKLVAKKGGKPPINMRKLWTFWQDGSYEIWVYKVSKMPAAVFYSNVDDNIYTNFTIDYDQSWLPKRINYTNNSVEQEGGGDVVFNFDKEGMLSGVSLKYDGGKGVSLRLDLTCAFTAYAAKDAFRIIPPFGYRKINRDHLKLMILTQVSGGLLKLKKHGINLRNFKF